MLLNISLIPVTVREGFDVQNLPPRASTVSEDTLKNVLGASCNPLGVWCYFQGQRCCPGLKCRQVGLDRFCRF